MTVKNSDWRTDIADIESLDDIDPYDLMVYLRHQFFESAKDLYLTRGEADRQIGVQCCETAERINDAMIAFYGE